MIPEAYEDLYEAAQLVIECWEHGDLAEGRSRSGTQSLYRCDRQRRGGR
jgi:hypothetical protein